MADKKSVKPDQTTTQAGMRDIRTVKLTGKPPNGPKRTVSRFEWGDFSGYLTQHLYHRAIQIRRNTSKQDLETAMQAAVKQWLDYQAADSQTDRAEENPAEGERPAAQPLEPALEESDFYKNQMRLLSEVGTGLWRLRQKMVKTGTDQPLEDLRRPFRFLESVWDALHEAGVTIQDHTNAPFDPHLALKVLTYEPTPNITREKVLETIKPSIYYRQHCIQMGEVIVAVPPEEPGAARPATTP